MYRCETISSRTGKYCGKKATYLYATRFICKECADKLIKNGANPAPTKIKENNHEQKN